MAKAKKPTTVVSKGNDKIGRTPNVSLLPIITCAKDVPCAKKCYCMKAIQAHPEVRKKWHENTTKWMTDPGGFSDDVHKCLMGDPEYFRWFVAGDLPDLDFLSMMIRHAREFPNTKFLAFTKRYEFFGHFVQRQGFKWYPRDFLGIPDNLTIILSRWNTWKATAFYDNRKEYPESEIVFKTEHTPEEDKNQFLCPGECEGCRRCWGMKPGQTVMFEEH